MDAPSAKLWLEYSDEIDLLVEEILEINKQNVYALTLHMLQTLEAGLKTVEDAGIVIMDVEKILAVVTEDERNDIIDAVRNNFSHYKKKLVELDPELLNRIREIERREVL